LKHNAPPVTYPLRRSPVKALIYGVVWFAVLAVVVSWIWLSRNSSMALLLGIGALALSALAGIFGMKSSPIGQLVWDGQRWHWESLAYQVGTAEYEVFVAADFQHIVVLHIKNHANASLWLWAERGAFPERWLDLRRAIYSPHRTTTDPIAPA